MSCSAGQLLLSWYQRRISLHKYGSATPLLVPSTNNGFMFSVSVGATSTLQPLSSCKRGHGVSVLAFLHCLTDPTSQVPACCSKMTADDFLIQQRCCCATDIAHSYAFETPDRSWGDESSSGNAVQSVCWHHCAKHTCKGAVG